MGHVVTCGHQATHHAMDSSATWGQEVHPFVPRHVVPSFLLPQEGKRSADARPHTHEATGGADAWAHAHGHALMGEQGERWLVLTAGGTGSS